MNEDIQRNYYAVIPANVRYDKRLKLIARLLYGEITALCNEKGYCWASNRYFAELYEVSNNTISSAISQLEEFGHIKCVYDKTQQNNDKRKIFIVYPQKFGDGLQKNDDTVYKKNEIPSTQKFGDGLQKNLEQNNTCNITNNNTTNNKKSEGYADNTEKQSSQAETEQLPPHLKLDFENINAIASYGDWDLETFKACVLNWVIKMSGQAVSGLRQVLKYYELENLERNFERRLNNCGWAIVFAVDDAYKSDVRFRKKDFVSFLNIYLTEYGKLKSKRENEGEASDIRMDFYKG